MRPADRLHNNIKNLNLKASDDLDNRIHSQIDNALANKQKKSSANQPSIWRIIMKSKITRFSSATAVVFGVRGMLVFLGNEDNLYAQVIKAFEKADTIHIITKEYRDGRWFKDYEIWYDHQYGTREEERYEGQTDIRIDNQQYEWRYKTGEKIAAKIKSYRDPDEFAVHISRWLSNNAERYPSGDKIIDGQPCKMYILSTPDGQKLASTWVNEQHRPMELEYEDHEDENIVTATVKLEYDKEFDKSLFSPDFDSDVKIVGPRELIEERYSLDTAIFKRKGLGFEFAVHELGFYGDIKYLVCSNRLTEQTRNEVSAVHPWTYYGGIRLYGRYNKSGDYLDTSEDPILLATMRHDGIQVDWYILVPGGERSKQNLQCDIEVDVDTANQLRKILQAKGLPEREKFRLNVVPTDAKEQVLSLREITSQIYSLGLEYDPIVHSFSLTKVVTEPDGNKVQAWKKPGTEVSEEEYVKACEERIEYYLNRN